MLNSDIKWWRYINSGWVKVKIIIIVRWNMQFLLRFKEINVIISGFFIKDFSWINYLVNVILYFTIKYINKKINWNLLRKNFIKSDPII